MIHTPQSASLHNSSWGFTAWGPSCLTRCSSWWRLHLASYWVPGTLEGWSSIVVCGCLPSMSPAAWIMSKTSPLRFQCFIEGFWSSWRGTTYPSPHSQQHSWASRRSPDQAPAVDIPAVLYFCASVSPSFASTPLPSHPSPFPHHISFSSSNGNDLALTSPLSPK